MSRVKRCVFILFAVNKCSFLYHGGYQQDCKEEQISSASFERNWEIKRSCITLLQLISTGKRTWFCALWIDIQEEENFKTLISWNLAHWKLKYTCMMIVNFKRLSYTKQIKLPLTIPSKWLSKSKLILKSLEKPIMFYRASRLKMPHWNVPLSTYNLITEIQNANNSILACEKSGSLDCNTRSSSEFAKRRGINDPRN